MARRGAAGEEQAGEDEEPDAPEDVADEVGGVDPGQVQRREDTDKDQDGRDGAEDREPAAGEPPPDGGETSSVQAAVRK